MTRGLEFQEKVFELIASKLRAKWPGATLSISDFKRGPIDIIAIVRRAGDELALAGEAAGEIEEKIFLECKDHASKLGLDVTGKAYCVALAEQPSYLIIVSRQGLEPQALRFAARLFCCKGITNLVLKDLNRHSQSPLSSINFLHYTLNELTNEIINTAVTTGISNRSRSPETTLPFILNSWWLKEADGIRAEVANNTMSTEKTVTLKSDRDYFLEMLFETDGRQFNLDEREIVLFIGEESVDSILPLSAQTDLESFLSIEFILDRKMVESLVRFQSVALHIEGENGPSVIQLSFPKLESISSLEIFSNLRPDLERCAFQELKSEGRATCMIVEGVGGVGKSYLSSNVSKQLGQAYGFALKTLHLSRRKPSTFLIQLALTLFNFSDSIHSEEDYAFQYNLLASYLKRFVHSEDLSDFDKNHPSSSPLEELPLDILTSLCAKCLNALNTPHIIWFQSCQDASPQTLYALDRLCEEVGEKSWKKLRFIFEYRYEGSLTTSWREFKSSRATDPNAGSHFVTINELSSNDVRQALSPLFAPTLIHEVALSLYKKTGGNPLYMDHVLRHFFSCGYIQLASRKDNGGVRFRILDIGGIRNELDHIDENTIQFLQRRLVFLLDKFDDEDTLIQNGKARRLLWLQALSPQPPTFDQLVQTLQVDQVEFHTIIRALVAERILSDLSLQGDIDFVHELIGLAASRIPINRQEMSELADNLVLHSDRHQPRACLNTGIAMAAVQRLHEAEQWLQAGYECTVGNDYYYQRLILNKLDNVLERRGQHVMQDKMKLLDVKMGLGWAELQAGSLINARKAYRSAEELCRWPFDRSDRNACRMEKGYRLKILHRLATVDIELLEISQSLICMQDVFSTVNDTNLLFHTSNRLLLALMYTNQPEIASAIAPFCLSLGHACTDKDALSVVMSDLGSLYFAEYPQLAANLWEVGAATASDKRQKTHSRINCLVADTVITGQFLESKHKDLEAEILSLKLTGQLSRMELLRGIGTFIAGNFDEAEHAFSEALKKAISHNQTLLRWLATYNLCVCRFAQGEKDEVLHDITSLAQELPSVDSEGSSILVQSVAAQKLFEGACERLSIQPIYQHERIPLPGDLHKTGPLVILSNLVLELKWNLLGYNKQSEHIKNNGHIALMGAYSCLIC